MEKIFLDANTFIDINERRDPVLFEKLIDHNLCISVISIGIWAYLYKRTVPNPMFEKLFDAFTIVETKSEITRMACTGPTSDFEDNVQIHSASEAECNVFLTKDTELLKLGYFGKVRICSDL